MYDHGIELLRDHAISDKSCNRAKAMFSIPGVIE